MYGAVTQIELNGFLEANSIDTEERKREIKQTWRGAAEVFQAIVRDEGGSADTVALRSLGEQGTKLMAKLQADPAFAKTFSNYPLSIEEVQIDKIVAGQRTVHLDFTDEIKGKVPASPEEVRDFCLNPGKDPTPLKIGRTAPNAFTLSSENPGLRLLGSFEAPYDPKTMQTTGGQPVYAVTLLFGYPISTINVYRVGKRLILNNGFHRLYALRSLGVQYAPMVIQQITHPELELPQVIADLPRDYLIEAPRPGLMKDFFDGRLVCEIRQRQFLKSAQIGWGTNEGFVPI